MNTSRSEGCTLTGALSVTTAVRDGVTVIHGPKGCAHHNFSLFHATRIDNECFALPRIVSTGLLENDIIFGGEEALEQTIEAVIRSQPASVYVLSTCVVETIGDDVRSVCDQGWDVPVLHVPTAGFLGGVFQTGYVNALMALSALAKKTGDVPGVNLVGEKNLEFEVDQHFKEVLRLISLLGTDVHMRYVRDVSTADIGSLGNASLNILREPVLEPVGRHLESSFRTPWISSFPVGLYGTIRFLEETAEKLGAGCDAAVEAELKFQQEMVERFSDLGSRTVWFGEGFESSPGFPLVEELITELDMGLDERGTSLPFPEPFPVGTAGISRLLHRWRRRCNA
jgi:nitrogenase molybdenum-iron protein alpha/beta subunit